MATGPGRGQRYSAAKGVPSRRRPLSIRLIERFDDQGVAGKVRKETASAWRSLASNRWKKASKNIESP